jgi:tetratricopeptide (TPR) repeat protein
LSKYISKYVDDYRPYEMLADDYLMLWQYKNITAPVDIALSLNPLSVSWNYLKAASFMWIEQFDKALPYFENVLQFDTKNPEIIEKIWVCKFHIAKTQEEIDKALYMIQRAYIMSWEDPAIAETLWIFLFTEWRYDEWEEYLSKSTIWESQREILNKLRKISSWLM